MDIRQERFDQVGELIADNNLQERHLNRTRGEFGSVYNITPENAESNLQKLFNIAIQTRPNTIGEKRYRRLASVFDPDHFLDFDDHSEAFRYLLDLDDIAQKIANEYLRQVAHAMEIKPEWVPSLHVPLDVHVVNGLIETDCPRNIEIANITLHC